MFALYFLSTFLMISNASGAFARWPHVTDCPNFYSGDSLSYFTPLKRIKNILAQEIHILI